ncbi:uncharacterized protein AC631_02876 [Debaryomyces fabryi]|uniref:TRUD domain-containing protein n=1 Tax=Debaryomyces fabryi TaxID=58627 RepID=A0A0V1PZ99_9ASCO|nr:uncharacterized protein AC631_02876 [Debaryomyces fabryi]KSA01381.1 hypothetical protein AC631_02876 [Debaryomyces fabryi]CUM55631.1 unnamed protein product [Debaryomyces fabryi]
MEEVNPVKRNIEESVDPSKKLKLDQQIRATKVVQENEVGITQFINEANRTGGGFFGTIKQRYSDFLVNEIDLNGEVVRLLDEGVNLGKTRKEKKFEKRQIERADLQNKTPEEIEQIKEAKKSEEEAKKTEDDSQQKYELSEQNRAALLELITVDELKQIEELFTTGNNMETKTSFPEKQTRGKLHQLLREAFQSKLESVTSAENTFRIALAKNSKNPRRKNPQESINHVDENGVVNYGLGPFKYYLHFTVYKENRETMEVASTISKFLRIPSKSIRYAGTKDRRGITCQRFCIHRGKVARVSSLNKGLKNAVLGGFAYEDRSLGLGDLNGNEFVITIRDIKSFNAAENVEDVVSKCFTSLRDKGYINYYGMQRFGTFSISTHVLGIYILKEDWKGAAELILSEQEIVAPDSIEARRIWAETSNPTLALKKMPRRCTAEHAILSTLDKESYDEEDNFSKQSYFKSIMSIPRNLRIMYAHAYQSYIWNLVVSKRFELFGLEVQEGDLVLVDKQAKTETNLEDDDEFEEDVVTDKYIRARPLTKEDVESGKYTIYDIVLPTPGFDIIYPANKQLEQVYVDAMAKDGLDPHNMARRVREFSLAGSYRPIMGKPTNLSYDIVNYSDSTESLVRTDLEILRLKKEAESKGEPIPEISRVIESNSADADKKAVVLRMQLGVSSYATMALREFMKADTSRLSENLNVVE